MAPGPPQSEVGAFCAEHRIVELDVDELMRNRRWLLDVPSAL
jgi:hypothetical protein